MAKRKKEKSRLFIIGLLAFVYTAFAIGAWISLDDHKTKMDNVLNTLTDDKGLKRSASITDFGLVGDSFGRNNSHLSLLTVWGLALSFMVQFGLLFTDYESKVREDAEKNDSDKAKHLETFEKSFFTLLDLFISTREALSSVRIDLHGKIAPENVKGRLAIICSMRNLSNALNIAYSLRPDEDCQLKPLLGDWVRDSKVHNHLTYRQAFLILKSLFKSVSELKVKHEDAASRFIDILKAMLSDDELYMISFWVIAHDENELRLLMKDLQLWPDFTSREFAMTDKIQNQIRDHMKA